MKGDVTSLLPLRKLHPQADASLPAQIAARETTVFFFFFSLFLLSFMIYLTGITLNEY